MLQVRVCANERALALRHLLAVDGEEAVDVDLRRQVVAASDLRFTGTTTAKHPAFLKELGTGGAVNGSIDSAAAKQSRVGRVHDRVNGELRDVASQQHDLRVSHFGACG